MHSTESDGGQTRPDSDKLAIDGSSDRTPGNCRFCDTELRHTFVDLGKSPLCESWLSASELDDMEPFYPLHAYVCESCFLVQVPAHVGGEEIFGGEYAYFSSFSDSWLSHSRAYADMVVDRFGLDGSSNVVEVASNDGYLLQFFMEQGIPVLGIEPADNVAAAATEKGVPTLVKFFGRETATELVESGTRADLLVGNNVLAHVPDVNDFVGGLKILLGPDGVLTMEFPHLMRLVEGNQFDTIYQEHYCYYSFTTVRAIFAAHGLTVFDVEEIPTHGGSLRVYARHTENAHREVQASVQRMEETEIQAGYGDLDVYRAFGDQVIATKHKLLAFLIEAKRAGKRVVGYGAPGKATTLLNYCGVGTDFIEYVVDRNPYKQGKFMPGTHIPVLAPDKIAETRPDYVLILPWNLKDEITSQLAYIGEWGGQFVVPIPEVAVIAVPQPAPPHLSSSSTGGGAHGLGRYAGRQE